MEAVFEKVIATFILTTSLGLEPTSGKSRLATDMSETVLGSWNQCPPGISPLTSRDTAT